MGEFVFVPTAGGEMQSYVALPETSNGCGIVLGSSVWGLNFDLNSVVEHYAALGYAVIAPNMFWRLAREHAMDYDFSRFDIVDQYAKSGDNDEGIVDLQAALAYLREKSGCTRTAGIGWCYGGRIVCLAATQPIFDLTIAMYPTWLEQHLHIAEKLLHPVELHLPEQERFGTVEDAVERIVHAFAGNVQAQTYLYPGVNHGFDFAEPHPYANHAAARLCDARAALTLDRVLVRGEAF